MKGAGSGASTRPATLPLAAAGVVVAGTLLFLLAFRLFEPDFWQHLLVGRAIWSTHEIPPRQIWTWPTYGAPDLTPSWLFRVLAWPLWQLAGVWGLYLWRAACVLVPLGLAWDVSRRSGARGFAALVVLAFAGYVLRTRQFRPETLVAVLLSVEIWILETRRISGRRDRFGRALWLIPLVWIWINAHISYPIGLLVLLVYALGEILPGPRQPTRPPRSEARDRTIQALPGGLLEIALACVAVAFLNPYGWRAVWQPFDYFLHLRKEPLFQTIDELRPLYLAPTLDNLPGLSLLLSWPLLELWRLLRGRADWVTLLLCLSFGGLALSGQRFLGSYVLVAAPFLARDLEGLGAASGRRGWDPSGWLRAALVMAACACLILVGLRRPRPALGVGIDGRFFPIVAADFVERHQIRGRAFNLFYDGGYLLHRFWPERDRLPFMDIHQSGGPEIRQLYLEAQNDPAGWKALDARFRFEWVLVSRYRNAFLPLLDVLDADSSLALVFLDDGGAVYLRSHGAMADLARRSAYHHLGAGRRSGALLGMAVTDTALRSGISAELGRQVRESPWHAGALSLLANLARSDGRPGLARELLLRMERINPDFGRLHERLGLVALDLGRPSEALAEFARERALSKETPAGALGTARAHARLGDRDRARLWYRRALRLDPGSAEAIDSLRALESPSGSGPP